METIQVVLDRRLEIREMEARDREGYLRHPQGKSELAWEAQAEWPDE